MLSWKCNKGHLSNISLIIDLSLNTSPDDHAVDTHASGYALISSVGGEGGDGWDGTGWYAGEGEGDGEGGLKGF